MTTTDRLLDALVCARNQVKTLGGDPRKDIAENGSIQGDEIQAAVLDEIDSALAASEASPIDTLSGLLPCPFCGSEKISDGYIRDGWEFFCRDCHGSASEYNPDAKTRSRQRWNSRALATRSDEGWRYVPVEATREMGAAVKAFSLTRIYSFEAFCGMWKAVLAAAPSPPDREKP